MKRILTLMAPEGAQAGAGGTESAQAKAQRARQFGRTYDHDKGILTITSAFDKDFKREVDLSKIPDHVIRGFALQAVGDYIVNEANEALKDETIGDEAARRKAALEATAEAETELVEGQVDFRAGVGLGGMRTAIGSLGMVLFELGKTFVMNAKGEKLNFNDVNGARAAVKSLYLDTTPVIKPHPQGGKDKDGNDRTITVTGRMFFNAIQEVPAVKAALAEKRKPKQKNLGTDEAILG